MRDRPAADLVVLAFTATVCVVLVLVAVGVTVAGSIPPNAPTADRYLDVLLAATATVLGALLGLLAGRRPERKPTMSHDDDDLYVPTADELRGIRAERRDDEDRERRRRDGDYDRPDRSQPPSD